MSDAQAQRQRRIDERQAILEEARIKKYGGKENLERLRREKREREADQEAEDLLKEVEGMGDGTMSRSEA